MKKFFFKILLILIPFVVFIILDFTVVKNQYELGYNASFVDKMARVKSINEPKIILTGNSNVAFGFRSELLEKEFNMPVVNLGLHGSLGNAFHENMAKTNIGKGDIVVLCHSDFNDDGHIGDYELAWLTMEHHYDLWDVVPECDRFIIWRAYPFYMFKCLKLWLFHRGNKEPKDCYSRTAFNEYGDNVYTSTHIEVYNFEKGDGNVPSVSSKCVNRINKLNRYVISKGATLLVAGYPIADGEITPEKKLFEDVYNELKEKLDCPVISDVSDYFFDCSLFYNIILHLNDEGAVLRTQQLIKDMHNYFGK